MTSRRLERGPGRDLRVLGVVALVAVVVGALVVVARSRAHPSWVQSARPGSTSPADAPYRIGGGIVCPLGRPVLAASNKASYPPGHPGHPPPSARPVACYPGVAQATAAGYPPAPLPHGAAELGGVYLAPTGRSFRTRCQRAADQLGFVVPCPGLLPTGAPGTAAPELCEGRGSCSGEQVFIVNDGGFLVPPGYLGVEKQAQGHLVIEGMPRRPDDPRPPGDRLGCYADHPVATATVHGTRALLLRCASGSALNSGHTLVGWSQRGVDMAVSLHGWSALNQRLVLLLAAHTDLVSPRHRPGADRRSADQQVVAGRAAAQRTGAGGEAGTRSHADSPSHVGAVDGLRACDSDSPTLTARDRREPAVPDAVRNPMTDQARTERLDSPGRESPDAPGRGSARTEQRNRRRSRPHR